MSSDRDLMDVSSRMDALEERISSLEALVEAQGKLLQRLRSGESSAAPHAHARSSCAASQPLPRPSYDSQGRMWEHTTHKGAHAVIIPPSLTPSWIPDGIYAIAQRSPDGKRIWTTLRAYPGADKLPLEQFQTLEQKFQSYAKQRGIFEIANQYLGGVAE